MLVRDAIAATTREVTPEGFLRVRARIGRTGVHDYRALELGRPTGFGPDEIVRVYRPPEEVFDPASMASFRGKPVTDDHPPEMVDARNWRRFAIGQSGHEVVQDGDHLATDLLIGDAGAAARALAGAELSNGYLADFEFGLGLTPDGIPYDAIQRNIRGNHIALVQTSRCGDSCRIGDGATQPCGCGGEPPEPALDAASLLSRVEALEHARRAGAEPTTTARPLQIADVALDAMVAERVEAVEAARRTFGPTFDARGRDAAALRRLVATTLLGVSSLDGRDDAYVAAAFDTLMAVRRSGNPLATHLAAGLRDAAASQTVALRERDAFLNHAWKGDQGGF